MELHFLYILEMLYSHHIFFLCLEKNDFKQPLSLVTFVYSPYSDSEHNSSSSNSFVIHLLQVIALVMQVVTITVRFIWGLMNEFWGSKECTESTDHYFFINYLLLYRSKVYTSLLPKYFPG